MGFLSGYLAFLDHLEHGESVSFTRAGVIKSYVQCPGCHSIVNPFHLRPKAAPLQEIWQSGQYFRHFREKGDLLAGECAECPYARQCRAGCTSIAWTATRSLGTNPYCIRQIEVESVLNDLASGCHPSPGPFNAAR